MSPAIPIKSHINTTHAPNLAIGLPDVDKFPIDLPHATNNDIAILFQVIRYSVRHKYWDNNNKKEVNVRIISIL